jgi:hypothetical protein
MRSTALRLPFQSTYWWSIARTYSWVLSRTSIKFNVSVFSSNLQPLHFAFPWRGCLFHNSFTLRMDFTLFATLDWVLPCPSILLDSSLCISWRGCLFHNSFTLRMDLLCLLHLTMSFYFTGLLCAFPGEAARSTTHLHSGWTLLLFATLDWILLSCPSILLDSSLCILHCCNPVTENLTLPAAFRLLLMAILENETTTVWLYSMFSVYSRHQGEWDRNHSPPNGETNHLYYISGDSRSP